MFVQSTVYTFINIQLLNGYDSYPLSSQVLYINESMRATYELLDLMVKLSPVAWSLRPTLSPSGPTIHMLSKSQSRTVLLYPSLKLYALKACDIISVYQLTTLSASNFSYFSSAKFRQELISCDIAVK